MNKPLWELVCVMSGGALGAACRYLLTSWQQSPRWSWAEFGNWPWGTVVVNLLGCLMIGVFFGWCGPGVLDRWRLFFVVGFLGSFTTFSALGWETWQGLRQGQILATTMVMTAQFLLGVAMVHLGFSSASWFAASGKP